MIQDVERHSKVLMHYHLLEVEPGALLLPPLPGDIKRRTVWRKSRHCVVEARNVLGAGLWGIDLIFDLDGTAVTHNVCAVQRYYTGCNNDWYSLRAILDNIGLSGIVISNDRHYLLHRILSQMERQPERAIVYVLTSLKGIIVLHGSKWRLLAALNGVVKH